MRIVAIADSDSYLKWAASLLATLAAEWEHELILVQTPVLPSASQRVAALATSGIDPDCVARLALTELPQRLATVCADAVLVAARGPAARVLIRLAAGVEPRPVVVTGLPGISVPATRKALKFRLQADLFVLHSRREILEFTALSAANGWDHRFALSTLPFVEQHRGPGGTDLIFAAQAVVPRDRSDRMRVARLLRHAAEADPSRRVVVKLRAQGAERQTHDEADPYPDLLAERGPLPSNLVISTEPMARALDSAEGLVTISSTAAIEAVSRGIPVIALDTFGVLDELINPVFVGSGLFAGEAAVIGREYRTPDDGWYADNYFHDRAENSLAGQLTGLVVDRRRGRLAARGARASAGGSLRLAWERKRAFGASDRSVSGAIAVAIGTPVRAIVVLARRTSSRVHGLVAETSP